MAGKTRHVHWPMSVATALALAALAAAAFGQSTRTLTVYRCTGSNGEVTFRNDKPCPKGERQEARRMQAPTPPPPAAARTEPSAGSLPVMIVAAEPPREPGIIANPDTALGPLPPPPLYRCRTYDGNSYLSDDGVPPARCLPLQVGGIDGSRENRSGAQACEMQQDHCERIPDQQLCQAWSEYDRQAQSLVALDNPDTASRANALLARTRKVMAATTCAGTNHGGTGNP